MAAESATVIVSPKFVNGNGMVNNIRKDIIVKILAKIFISGRTLIFLQFWNHPKFIYYVKK